jgi:class 3 adenylate cyclase
MKRKISAILAADIVKYSALVADDEEDTVRRLAGYRAAFAEVTARHGGRIVNTVGDAVLAEFSSSVDAVRCALDAQESIRLRERAYPAGRQMLVRIGITLADIVDRDGELFGDGVNMAARYESLAPPGGICVSQTVHEQVADKLSVAFEDLGKQRVKNIANPVRAFVIAPHAGIGGGKVTWKGLWKGLKTRKARVLAAAAVLLAVAAAAAAVQSRRTVEPGTAASAAVAPRPGGPSQARFDDTKLRALAASQGIPLPRQIKLLVPAATVPAKWTEYLGAWGGDKRWNRGGRQAILVVESIDEAGTALGVYAHGLPLAGTLANQAQGRFGAFTGTISDKGLTFPWGQANLTFILMADGTLWGRWDVDNDQRRFDMTIVLERIE